MQKKLAIYNIIIEETRHTSCVDTSLMISSFHTKLALKNLETMSGRNKLYESNLSTLIYFSLFWITCKGQMGKKISNMQYYQTYQLMQYYTILSTDIKRKKMPVYLSK